MCHLLVDLPSIEPILSIEENYYETKYFEHVDIRKRLIEYHFQPESLHKLVHSELRR